LSLQVPYVLLLIWITGLLVFMLPYTQDEEHCMRLVNSLTIGLLALLGSHLAVAMEVAEPGEAGVIAERLERIDQVIEEDIETGKLPGAVALVARDGKIVYHRAFGNADLASGEAMRTDSIFRIASMTKAVTSVGVMILYEQGRFQLTDPVSKYLPEFANMRVISKMADDGTIAETVPAVQPIRIIDLLSHTSGVSYLFISSDVQKSYKDAGLIDGLTARDLVLKDQMALLARQPLLFEPGTKWMYGLNTDLLGYLIEVVSGQALDVFFAEHILGPLGMEDTYFYLPDDKRDRLATLYAHVEGQGLVVSKGDESEIKMGNPNYPVEGARTYFSGGAGLSSTAYDYARFIQMLLNEGELDGVRVLSRKSVELMRTPRFDYDGDSKPDIGLGFGVVTDLGKYGELGSPGMYSWGGAFNTSYWIDPKEGLIGVFMSQVRPVNTDIDERFKTLVYQALE
jgi:CubicO group peptidase (beta-lactamase class C family)